MLYDIDIKNTVHLISCVI